MNLDHFCQQSFEKKGRFLGFDVGEKTIGLSLSDANRTIASPFQTLHRTKWKQDAEILLKIIKDYTIVGMVVGLPLNMDGSEGPRCQSIRQFVANLLTLIDLPICFWDERLSTMAVTRTLLEADLSRVKRKKVVDKMAAAYILQGLLDAFGHLSKSI
jgi:putative Holliday junction resolvase